MRKILFLNCLQRNGKIGHFTAAPWQISSIDTFSGYTVYVRYVCKLLKINFQTSLFQ